LNKSGILVPVRVKKDNGLAPSWEKEVKEISKLMKKLQFTGV